MKTIRRADFEAITQVVGPCASIYLPLNPTGREGEGDSLRLRKLADEAESQLLDRGYAPEQVQKLLSQVRSLPLSKDWATRGKAMAILVSPSSAQFLTLDASVEPEAWGDDHLHIRPLLPLVVESDRFFLLALSENHVQLFEADDERLRAVDVPSLPENMDDALQLEEVGRCAETHSGNAGGLGRRGAIFHGQGGKPDTAKTNRHEFIHMVAAAVDRRLLGRREPLVLATVGENASIWREESTYPDTRREFVAGSPDHTPLAELHQHAWPFIQAQLASEGQEAYDRLSNAKGTSRAILGLSQVLPAAVEGKVDTLFIDCRKPICGRFDRTTGEVVSHEHIPDKRGDDLLELAIRETLRHRGQVFSLESVSGTRANVEAILRY